MAKACQDCTERVRIERDGALAANIAVQQYSDIHVIDLVIERACRKGACAVTESLDILRDRTKTLSVFTRLGSLGRVCSHTFMLARSRA